MKSKTYNGKAFADGYAKGKAESAELVAQLQRERNSLINLLADLRTAVGDHGRRMQPELLEYCRELGGRRRSSTSRSRSPRTAEASRITR